MSDALERARVAVKRLKVFPLPPVVLLPGSAVPLHLFEARYRELAEHALATDGVFAMAQVLPGQEGQLAGAPQLEPMLCVGVIGFHEKLSDGRHNVVLIGVARARILRELPRSQLYREVEAELLEDPVHDFPEEELLRQALVELLARIPLEIAERLAQVTSRARGGALADVVAAGVMPDAARRFEVLNTLDVPGRLVAVTEELMMVIGGLRPRKSAGLLN